MAPSTPLNTSTPRQEQSNVPNFDDTISSGNSGSVTATADQNIINHRTEEDEDDNDDDDDEHGWIAPPHLSVSIPLHARLHELDHILRCSICHSYMSIPASIAPCHHTFCSECIRVSLKRSIYKKRVAECPICRAGTDERSIVPNHSMGMVIEKFCDMKKLLKHTLKEERRLRGIVVRMESDDTEGTSVKDTIKSLEKHVEEGSKTEATSSVSQSLAEVLDFGANSANGAPITTSKSCSFEIFGL